MVKIDKYKFGAKTVCIQCERGQSFNPPGVRRKAKPVMCPKCLRELSKLWGCDTLLKNMGKPQYWTGGGK